MSLKNHQFERFDSEPVIWETLEAIRADRFSGMLVTPDDRKYSNFRRPGVLGARLHDGSFVFRGRDERYVVDQAQGFGSEPLKTSFTMGDVARLMREGELILGNGYGYRLLDAEKELGRELAGNPDLADLLKLAATMETDRRLPFLGILVVAAQKSVEIDLETASMFARYERSELIEVGRAIDKGEWLAPPAPR